MIRKATANDFDFIYGLYMHPQINPFLLYEMIDKESFQPIFEDLLAKDVKYVFEKDGRSIGMCKLIPLTYRCSHIVYVGGVAISMEYAGKGYGKRMLQEILANAKQQGFLRVELSVSDGNEKAIRLYEQCGFVQEGVLRKYCHYNSEQRFINEIMMSYLVDE